MYVGIWLSQSVSVPQTPWSFSNQFGRFLATPNIFLIALKWILRLHTNIFGSKINVKRSLVRGDKTKPQAASSNQMFAPRWTFYRLTKLFFPALRDQTPPVSIPNHNPNLFLAIVICNIVNFCLVKLRQNLLLFHRPVAPLSRGYRGVAKLSHLKINQIMASGDISHGIVNDHTAKPL